VCASCTTITGGAWIHAPPQEKPKEWVDLERFSLFLLPGSAVTLTVTYNKEKK
jgi:hypothetical protein